MKSILWLPLALATTGTLLAGSDTVTNTDSSKTLEQVVAPPDQSIFDRLWALPQLYRNDANPFIQEFDLIGRFEMDYFNVDSNRGDKDFTEIRRLRFGEDAFLFGRHLEIKTEFDTALDTYGTPTTFYNRFTNMYVKYHANDAFNITVGKTEAHFGYDREVSDVLQPFFERSFFDDQLIGSNDYITGALISGQFNHFGYLTGIYSDSVDKTFGNFNGGQSYLAELNYDFAPALNANRALLVVDYLHVDGINKNTNVFQNFNNAAAIYFDYKKGRFGWVTQFAYGDGITTHGNLYQIMVMPTFDITDKLQVEFRYALGLSDASNGITNGNRQEKTIGKFTGDTYNAPYLGLNYFIYGYKLRVMAGVQYGDLNGGTGANAGFNAWTTMVGFRMYF